MLAVPVGAESGVLLSRPVSWAPAGVRRAKPEAAETGAPAGPYLELGGELRCIVAGPEGADQEIGRAHV